MANDKIHRLHQTLALLPDSFINRTVHGYGDIVRRAMLYL